MNKINEQDGLAEEARKVENWTKGNRDESLWEVGKGFREKLHN